MRRKLLYIWLPIAIVAPAAIITTVLYIIYRETDDVARHLDEKLSTEDVVAAVPAVDENARIVIDFHDAIGPDDAIFSMTVPTMRFGVSMLADPNDPKNRTNDKRLTFDRYGRTSNTCARVDGSEFLLGDTQFGKWEVKQENGKEQLWESLGTDPHENNRKRIGRRSTWLYSNPLITIEQQVEIVPGGLSADGKSRLLDTCVVRYVLSNKDRVNHKIGLRFLLDTYIGTNDGAPFAIPGEKELCDTFKDFDKPETMPDFIAALERSDVNNPGTVVQVNFKVGGGLEAPSRVILGAWPNSDLRNIDPMKAANANRHNTLWEVPLMPMNLKDKREGDSAVTLYWDQRELPAGESRVLGFAYGLGSLSGDASKGALGLTAGGELIAGKNFTLTAYVTGPKPDQTITLTVPTGLSLVGDQETQDVPASSESVSTVTWHVKADKSGVFTLKLQSGGDSLQHKIVVRPEGAIYR